MSIKVKKPGDVQVATEVRQASIPADLSYMTNTEYGQEMLRLVAEIAEEQGTRTTKEINQLIDLMRGNHTNANLS